MITNEESNAWRPSIPGWSTDILRFYSDAAKEIRRGSTCVELGVWCGRSLIFLAEQLAGENCRIVGVDAWPDDYGFGGTDEKVESAGGVYAWSLGQMLAGAPEYMKAIQLLRWESDQAARLFDDRSVDFLFVDAAHDYEHVLADLKAWVPKVKHGGIIAGHDYAGNNPGVIQAVDETFGTSQLVFPVSDGCVWRVK